MVSAVLFITFFVLLVLNVPISICLGLASCYPVFRIIRKHYGKGRYFHQTDPFR